MTIALMRHAPVLADWDMKLSIDELSSWIEEYDQLPIDQTPPPSELFDLSKKADWIVASSLSRTHDSLAVLGLEPDEIDSLFDEAPVPVSGVGWLRLRPMHWLSYFRFRALVGWMLPQSDMKVLISRANKAADHLIIRAKEHENILLMGHGAINHFIGKSLIRQGWRKQRRDGTHNWSFAIYTLPGGERSR
jgi:hypothetical protein